MSETISSTPQNSMGGMSPSAIETFSPLLKPKPLRRIIPPKKELKVNGK